MSLDMFEEELDRIREEMKSLRLEIRSVRQLCEQALAALHRPDAAARELGQLPPESIARGDTIPEDAAMRAGETT